MAPPKRKASPKGGLLSWAQALPWQRENEFILTGYRAASFSSSRSIKSILEIHNETSNIWSHLIGAVQFAFSLYYFLYIRPSSTYGWNSDIAAVALYYVCVVICFILSTIFHTFADHSPEMNRFGNELDHLGIVLVIWGTGVSSTYFAFYCETNLRNTYMVTLTTTAVGCAIFTLRPKFRLPTYRTMRFLMYCFLGSSMFAPIMHGWMRFGGSGLDARVNLSTFFGLAVVNFSGAAIYAARIPERFYPKSFDLLGQSHNWMHVLVWMGAIIRMNGLLLVRESWDEYNSKYGTCQQVR